MGKFLLALLLVAGSVWAYRHGALEGRVNSVPVARSAQMQKAIQGRVLAVLDGDTITVLDEYHVQWRIRLAGIDAPEKAQAFGVKSKAYLAGLIFGKEVKVEGYGRDRYGRTIGRVTLAGRDMNLAMVQMGMAWVYRAYIRPALASTYLTAETIAQRDRRGLWADPAPIPPWDFRHSNT